MNGKINGLTIKMFVWLALGIYAVFHWRTASALNVKKPAVMEGGADTSQLDQAGTTTIEFVLYLVYILGTVSLVIGLLLCLPIIGKPQLGRETMKGSIIVLLLTGCIHIIYGFLGSLF